MVIHFRYTLGAEAPKLMKWKQTKKQPQNWDKVGVRVSLLLRGTPIKSSQLTEHENSISGEWFCSQLTENFKVKWRHGHQYSLGVLFWQKTLCHFAVIWHFKQYTPSEYHPLEYYPLTWYKMFLSKNARVATPSRVLPPGLLFTKSFRTFFFSKR